MRQAALSTRNEALVQALGDIVYESWPEDNRVHWSGEYTRILGYTPAEIGNETESWTKRVHPDDLERVKKDMGDARTEGRLFNVEYRFRRKDGVYIWMLDRGKPFLDEAGNLERVIGVCNDISERKRTEEALRASEQRLLLALDALNGGVWDWNLQTGEIYRSPKWKQMLGYEPGEYRNTIGAWEDVIHPDDKSRVLSDLQDHLDGRSPQFSVQYRIRAKSGESIWVEARGRVSERSADGKPLRAIGVDIDVTERRRVEEAIARKAREEEFIGMLGRMLLENRELDEILDTVVRGLAGLFDLEFAKILELLPAADALLLRAGHGWRAGLVGTATVPTAKDSQSGYTLLSKQAVVVEDLRTEVRFRGPALLTDHGVVSGMSVVIGDIGRPYGVLGVHTSIRRRFENPDVQFLQNVANIVAEAIKARKAEQLVLQSRERLRNLAARLHRVREEEQTRIAREIHDELGQTLTGLRIDLSWILERLPRRSRELSERARSALLLVDETLDTVRRISHDLRPAMLDDLGLEAAIEWHTGEFARRTGCRCSVDLKAGEIGLDNDRDTVVFRILQEALTNVSRHAAADRVEVSLRALDGRLVLEVSDNGRGISEEEVRSGNSIGLIGMRERAGGMGGRVQVGQGRKSGTIVRLEMPLDRH